MLCISQPVPKLYPFQRVLGFQNYYFLRAYMKLTSADGVKSVLCEQGRLVFSLDPEGLL